MVTAGSGLCREPPRPAIVGLDAGELVPERARRVDAREVDRLPSGRRIAHGSPIANGALVPAALSEVQPSFVIVVRTASQLDLIDTRLAAERVGIQVMELDEPARVAAMAGRSNEGA